VSLSNIKLHHLETNEVIAQIKSSVHKSDPTAEVFLFGSRARGTNRVDSDWDLLILVNDPKITPDVEEKFRGGLYSIELESEQIISSFIYTKDFWKNCLQYSPLFVDVKRDGLRL
jgi:predicted nucleotidyltransferase